MNKIEEGCCIVACESPLDGKYWESQWESQTIGWDLGMPAPPLVSFIDTIEDKEKAILIPGCGNAYEASYLLKKGFKNINLIDISITAVDILKEKFKNNPEVKVVCGDFFEHNLKYDLIIEQTFFCALAPSLRQKYAWKMHQILNENGSISGLLFNRQFEANPPFGGNKEEYEKLFSGAFDIEKLKNAENSAAPRANSELIFIFKKKNNVAVNLYSFDGITCVGCKNSVTESYSQIDGIVNVSMSIDFKTILIVSKYEISQQILEEKINYDPDYKINKYE